jgi:hypothetical protein
MDHRANIQPKSGLRILAEQCRKLAATSRYPAVLIWRAKAMEAEAAESERLQREESRK